jgi:hypothetical protein
MEFAIKQLVPEPEIFGYSLTLANTVKIKMLLRDTRR